MATIDTVGLQTVGKERMYPEAKVEKCLILSRKTSQEETEVMVDQRQGEEQIWVGGVGGGGV